MNGWTRSPTTIAPLSAPAAMPTATQTTKASKHRADAAAGRGDPQDEPHRHARQRVHRADRQIDAARDDDDGRAHRHDRDEARVGGGLDQRVRVEEVVDRRVPSPSSTCEPASSDSAISSATMTPTRPNCCERSSRRTNGERRVARRGRRDRPGSSVNRPSSFRRDDPLPRLAEPVDAVFDDVAGAQVDRRLVAEARRPPACRC